MLATSPNGIRRIAWEAQLAGLTLDEVRERTSKLRASGLEVCWVTDTAPPWLGHVPSVRVCVDDTARSQLMVVDNILRFDRQPDYGDRGWWVTPTGLTLTKFVAAVCAGSCLLHTISTSRLPHPPNGIGTLAWTAHRYIQLERRQLAADARRLQDDRDHEARIRALLTRQEALIATVTELVHRRTGVHPRVEAADREDRWAKGVPVFVGDMPYALICPVASRLAPLRRRLRELVLIVATERERRALSRAAVPGQEILVLEPTPRQESR